MGNDTRGIVEGTVIAGTMRAEDLIPAFYGVLEDLDGAKAATLKRLYMPEFQAVNNGRETKDTPELVNALFDALNENAPEGMYFGAHPGDGSDYGFWTIEEDFDF